MTTTGQKFNITIDVISHLFNNPFDNFKLLYDIYLDSSNISPKTSPNVFYAFLLPPFFLRRDNGAVWLSHIATNLFATRSTAQPKQINPWQLPTHFFGFFKPSLAIANLAHLFLQKGRQKTKKLNSPTHKIGLLRSLFARALDAPKSAPQACSILFLSATNSCLTSFSKNTLGFP